MRRPYLAALCLGLAACGDDSAPGKPASGSGSPSPLATPGGTDGLPTSELEDIAARARAAGAGRDAAAQRAAEELTAAFKGRLGPMLEADGKKAAAFAARPLTPADVELYLALAPRMREAAAGQGAAAAVLAERGLSGMEWGALSGRIGALRMALRVPDATLDPKTAADVDVLRPFADRLEVAGR